jgi:hypothetical protein
MTDETFGPLEKALHKWQDEKATQAEPRSVELEEQTEAAIAWIRAKWGDDKPCPWCGNDTYYVTPPEPLAVPDGGQTVPYISVICRNCGQVARIDLRIFDASEREQSDREKGSDS